VSSKEKHLFKRLQKSPDFDPIDVLLFDERFFSPKNPPIEMNPRRRGRRVMYKRRKPKPAAEAQQRVQVRKNLQSTLQEFFNCQFPEGAPETPDSASVFSFAYKKMRWLTR